METILSWIVTGLVAMGLAGTWIRNGKSQTKRDQEIKDNQGYIIKKLDDSNTGLSAINEKLHNFETHCAQVSTSLDERVLGLDKDIEELKKGKGK